MREKKCLQLMYLYEKRCSDIELILLFFLKKVVNTLF